MEISQRVLRDTKCSIVGRQAGLVSLYLTVFTLRITMIDIEFTYTSVLLQISNALGSTCMPFKVQNNVFDRPSFPLPFRYSKVRATDTSGHAITG